MNALYAPIILAQGEDMSGIVFGLYEPTGDPFEEPTVPLDITGCTVHMAVRTAPTATDAVLDLTSQFVIDAPYGQITPVVSAPTIAALAPFVGWYDVFVTFLDGQRARTHYGEFTVNASSTRDP